MCFLCFDGLLSCERCLKVCVGKNVFVLRGVCCSEILGCVLFMGEGCVVCGGLFVICCCLGSYVGIGINCG